MRYVAAVVTAVIAAAVGTSHGESAVTSDCTSQAVRAAFASFAAALNRGDSQRLDALFARPPQFGWYSSNPPGLRRPQTAKNRASLLAYFRTRHLEHDRLRLVSFTFDGNSPGYGSVVFEMKRSAGDYRNGTRFGLIGKGSAVCSDRSVRQPVQSIVISLGGPGSDTG